MTSRYLGGIYKTKISFTVFFGHRKWLKMLIFKAKCVKIVHILQELPKSPVALQCIVGLTFGMMLWTLRHELMLGCLNRILVIWPEMGLLGPKRVQKESNLISHVPLVVESRLTPQNDHKTRIKGGAFIYVYPSDHRKCPKYAFFNFGVQNSRKSIFLSKMAAQGHWFGLKMILINYISDYYISNDFSMNSFKFSPSLDPLDLDCGPEYVQKCLKIIIFLQKRRLKLHDLD